MLDEAAELGADDDVVTQVRVRAGRAKLLARRDGNLDEAEALAREAVALAAETEYVDLRGDSLLALGRGAAPRRPHRRSGRGDAGRHLRSGRQRETSPTRGRTRALLAEL